ncbi:hypothetical protein L6218_12140 [Pseudomonas syringae pv. syringae]|uniref:hypothetical protein n=1 Tax=Pseudomonas TaxID=286 RepID=UPI0006B911FC|nr:hypothetical protein [Pseudomonas syringae]MCF5550630.1 hypothetical protein [Pseudomonas syringae]MCH5498834.1 hypothetical protein [Pseudomonas syringae pv. syringae]MCH5525139.1 hypothetical protein [Pseudomonas syringae pv. syringae]MCH5560209.1 hypothetical protein [Pseudomonas syringae pv. syringae]MCH5565316.1 hypothetical protein [Pseudomonas syringae pv. syringae]
MMYRNVVAAVVRALAAETINSAGGCDFEPKVQCAKPKGEITGKEAALLADSIVHRLLHAQLSPRQWNALVAKYSTHKGRKIDSIGRLVSVVKSSAPQRFTQQAVLVWAVPQQSKGVQRQVREVAAPEARIDEDGTGKWDWRNNAAQDAAERANRHASSIAETRSGEMIVLAASNYDMTNWDSQGLTERTYQRWNKAIRDGLEGIVNEALTEAQHLLELAGVLENEAA